MVAGAAVASGGELHVCTWGKHYRIHFQKDGTALPECLKDYPEEVETGRKTAVAGYLDPWWENWLQGHRVELKAMSTPQFLAWLEGCVGRG